MSSILITSPPPGEAPLEIRAAWIGAILPVCNERREPTKCSVVGILTGPKSFAQLVWSILTLRYQSETWDGFYVKGADAVAVLEKINLTAAMWWRQNVPHAVKPGTILVFPAECCEVVAKGRS